MIKSIKLQVAAYKWAIIISMISLLALGLGWQYHRATVLQTKTETLIEKNEEIRGQLTVVADRLDKFKRDTDKALEDLVVLREELLVIDGTTSNLQSRVDVFKTAKPATGGTNSQEIEKEVNTITEDLFKRIEDASKGEVK